MTTQSQETRNRSELVELRNQIEAAPKISLHDHLDGGLRLSTIIDIASRRQLNLPSTDIAELRSWVAERANSGSLERYLEVDELNVVVLQYADALEQAARERVIDLALENVIYAELRWAPEETTALDLSLLEAVEAVARGIRAGIAVAAQHGKSIRVGQLLCALRHTSQSGEVAQLAIDSRGLGVVGFDIAGPEAGFSLAAHRKAFDLVQSAFLPITVHAGEAAGLESLKEALVIGHATRIGHGVRILDDITLSDEYPYLREAELGPLAAWIRDNGIALEICPTSNLQTQAVTRSGDPLSLHPFDLLYRLGFKVTVSPDNTLNSATSVTEENWRLCKAFEYALDDVGQFQLNAAEASFLPLQERMALANQIRSSYGLN